MDIIALGGTNNGPILQALHCIYNVGLLLAPVVAQPFLRDKSNNGDEEDFFEDTVKKGLEDTLESHGWSYITVPYVLAGLLALVSAFVYFSVLCGKKLCNSSSRDELSPTDPESVTSHVQRNRYIVFFLIFMFFVFCCLIETNYTTFLATFAVDYLEWSDKSAAQLTSVFILALTIGRFFGIFVVKALGAKKLIWCSLILALLSVVPLYFLNYSKLIIWISSGVLGLSIAPLYATTLTYANDTVHLSGKLGSILIFAGCLGYTVGPFLQGLLFSQFGILSFLYLCSAALLCALLMKISLSVFVRMSTLHIHVIIPTAPPDYESSETTQLLEKDPLP